jgi:hypothetical protein
MNIVIKQYNYLSSSYNLRKLKNNNNVWTEALLEKLTVV